MGEQERGADLQGHPDPPRGGRRGEGCGEGGGHRVADPAREDHQGWIRAVVHRVEDRGQALLPQPRAGQGSDVAPRFVALEDHRGRPRRQGGRHQAGAGGVQPHRRAGGHQLPRQGRAAPRDRDRGGSPPLQGGDRRQVPIPVGHDVEADHADAPRGGHLGGEGVEDGGRCRGVEGAEGCEGHRPRPADRQRQARGLGDIGHGPLDHAPPAPEGIGGQDPPRIRDRGQRSADPGDRGGRGQGRGAVGEGDALGRGQIGPPQGPSPRALQLTADLGGPPAAGAHQAIPHVVGPGHPVGEPQLGADHDPGGPQGQRRGHRRRPQALHHPRPAGSDRFADQHQGGGGADVAARFVAAQPQGPARGGRPAHLGDPAHGAEGGGEPVADDLDAGAQIRSGQPGGEPGEDPHGALVPMLYAMRQAVVSSRWVEKPARRM